MLPMLMMYRSYIMEKTTQEPNPRVQSLWIGPELSLMERLTIESYLQNGSAFHLYTYGPVDNIPQGTTIKDGEEIIPLSAIHCPLEELPKALFSDFFRWELLFQKGGLWADMDNVCLKPIGSLPETFVSLEKAEGKIHSCIGFMGFPPRHKVARLMRRRARHPFRLSNYQGLSRKRECLRIAFTELFVHRRRLSPTSPGIARLGWGVIAGPTALTRVLNQKGLNSLRFDLASYVNCDNFPQLYSPSESIKKEVLHGGYFSVHMFNSILKRSGIDKNAPLEGSFYAFLLKKYGLI